MSAIISVVFNRLIPMGDGVAAKVAATNAQVAQRFVAAADPKTPKDTGRLVGTKVVESTGAGASITYTAPYAGYQEFGTRYIAPRAFASGAADEVAPWYMAELGRAVEGL